MTRPIVLRQRFNYGTFDLSTNRAAERKALPGLRRINSDQKLPKALRP